MSYKKNSKSRLARFMLALTIMGGVGQRLADNKSYALTNQVTVGKGKRPIPYDLIDFSYLSKGINEAKVQNVTFDTNRLYGNAGPVEGGKLNSEAANFGRLMNCRLLEGGQVGTDGVYRNSGNYDVAKVKEACTKVFSDAQTGVLKGFIDLVGGLPAGDKSNVNTVLGLLASDYWNTELVGAFENDKVVKALASSAKEPLAYVEKSKSFLKNFIEGIVSPESEGENAPNIYFVMYIDGDFAFTTVRPDDNNDRVLGSVASKMSLDSFRNGFFHQGRQKVSYKDSFLNQRLHCNGGYNGILDVTRGFDSNFKGNFIMFEGSIFHVDSADINSVDLNPLSVMLAIAEYKKQKDAGDVNVAEVKAAYRSFDCALSHIDTKEDLGARYDSYANLGGLSKESEFKNYAVNKVWLMCLAIQGRSTLNSPISMENLLTQLDLTDVYERVSGVLQVICNGLTINVFEAGEKIDNLVKFFKFLLGGNGDRKKDGKEDKKEKKSSKIKPILITTLIAGSLGAGAFALHKTGYGKKLVDFAKELFNKSKDRPGLQKNNNSSVGTNPAPGKVNPVSSKPSPVVKKPN